MRWLALCLALAAMPAAALDLRGPVLGAASNFAQGWQPEALDGAAPLGITEFRDEIVWEHVERPDARLVFGTMRENYAPVLAARGAGLVLLAYTGHPSWENGQVPRTPEGQAAFAAYLAALVDRFPAIHSVEIGNEFNSWEFAAQEGWPDDLTARARDYVRLLAASARAVHAADPEIRILGGAAHSIPLAWIEAVLQAGGAQHMDAFVLHPYTTEPEQIARQIAAARALPGFAEMPVEITEFGTTDAPRAPGYLLRMYCQMALSGVTRAVWYPFSPRGDGLIPLVTADGTPTDVGRTYALIRDHLEGAPAADAAPDPFTYACRFGDRVLVLWGAPRSVALADGLRALTPTGAPAAPPLRLSRTEPLLILSEGPTDGPPDGPSPRLGDTVRLGPQTIRADSFDQFSYTGADGPFSLHIRHRGALHPLAPRPGQERDGVPWTPYLGYDADGTVRVGPGWATPSAWGPEDPLEILYRYRAPRAETVTIVAEAAPDAASADGITITLTHNGTPLATKTLTAPGRVTAGPVTLAPGDRLDAVLGPNATATGDHTRLRVTVEAAR
ncbi:hypothetical protein P1J78_13200 [Psychromarinibacter sp. C21-152]|uniref:Glycosyl hydrolase n=1 Tax=Psychromarinibacter sediminicola TaxID=3033385 RepID=A0AAE3NVF4_9RHOB|nr:hypothetical protein [Psychromarinibacter sediminicola]MDF0601695.1 hypothetical protein [Psychromarinibacter sediminicola]